MMQSAKVIAGKLVKKFGTKELAKKCADEMKKMFKAGWYAFGPDHSHTDTEEWWVLIRLKKEINKL